MQSALHTRKYKLLHRPQLYLYVKITPTFCQVHAQSYNILKL